MASGTLFVCEDGAWYPIPPPTGGNGPWVLFWPTQGNQGFPYWESLANLMAQMRGPAPAMKPPAPPGEQENM